jgi:hypothetical protein
METSVDYAVRYHFRHSGVYRYLRSLSNSRSFSIFANASLTLNTPEVIYHLMPFTVLQLRMETHSAFAIPTIFSVSHHPNTSASFY